jgi:hypothetical protein
MNINILCLIFPHIDEFLFLWHASFINTSLSHGQSMKTSLGIGELNGDNMDLSKACLEFLILMFTCD